MKYRLRDKILDRIILPILRKVTGHEYGCCNKILKRCSKCIYVKEDNKA